MDKNKIDYRFWITIISAWLGSAACIIWWGAGIEARVQANTNAILDKTKDRFHRSEAMSELAVRDQMIKGLSEKLSLIEVINKEALISIRASITRMESKLDQFILLKSSQGSSSKNEY